MNLNLHLGLRFEILNLNAKVVAVEALALVLAAKIRVPNLERAFMVYCQPLLEMFQAKQPIERRAI